MKIATFNINNIERRLPNLLDCNLDRAADRVHDAAELDDAAVAGAFDGSAAMRGDGGIDQVAAETAKAREGSVLVHAGKAAVPDDVGHQDRG